jgi:hypothetical protein
MNGSAPKSSALIRGTEAVSVALQACVAGARTPIAESNTRTSERRGDFMFFPLL